MGEILVLFKCGHIRCTDGSEHELVCSCGSKEIERIDAPAPVFRGHATGPCAQTDVTLPPQAVSFGKDE